MKRKKKKQKEEPKKYFVVVNSKFEYFCGLAYGGEPVFHSDFNEAKPLDNERKFHTLQYMCYGEELIIDYIN
jgi:hypothetical protein